MSKELLLPFPIQGYDANWAYSAQPAKTTPGCLNVRGYSSDEERARGGSRPGLRAAYEQQLGGGTPVQWLGWLDCGFGDSVQYGDGFDYDDGDLSAADAWSQAAASLKVQSGAVRLAGGALPYANVSSGDYQSFAGDTWDDFVLEAGLRWAYGTTGDVTFWVSSATGSPADGARVKVAYASSWVAWPGLGFSSVLTITLESGSGKSVYSRPMGVFLAATGGTLRVEASRESVRAFWDGVEVASLARDDGTCSKAGFTMSMSKPDSSPLPDSMLDFRLLDWRLAAASRSQPVTRKLVAVAGRQVWAESAEGVLGESPEDERTLADVALYSAARHAGRLFLVDGAAPVFYNPMGAEGERVLPWTARRGRIDPSCRLLANWRNRLVLAGAEADPLELHFSRQDDPWDFEYEGQDAQAACSGGEADAGRVSDPVTALCPMGDDVLVIGCTRSVWALHGDPRAGGRLACRSDQTGILSHTAWTADPQGNLYFLGEGGLYAMAPSGAPKNLSRSRVPALGRCAAVQPGRSAAAGQTYVSLAYDADRHGLLILLTPVGGGEAVHCFYDIRNDAFWPESYPEDVGPSCAAYYSATGPEYRKCLLGGLDGWLYQFDESAKSDTPGGEGAEETAIASHVWIGPMRLAAQRRDAETRGRGDAGTGSGAFGDAVVTGLVAVLSSGSDGADFGVHAAATPEAALAAPAAASGAWSAGRNASRPRVRGGAHAIKISNATAARRWAMESLAIEFQPGGRQR